MVLIYKGKTVKTHPLIEKLEDRRRSIGAILYDSHSGFVCFKDYDGLNEGVGRALDDFHNSHLTGEQLKLAIAMSTHPLVEKLLTSFEETRPFNYNPTSLIENKVLNGLRIIDLGCGYKPAFARVARILGARVHTVDKIGADEFICRLSKNKEKPMRENDRKFHIPIDLCNPLSIKYILEKTGKVDLVTEANLSADGFREGENIALPLLREGGIYQVSLRTPKIKIGQKLTPYEFPID